MALTLPNGSTVAIATAYGTVVNVTGATNAAEAVLTTATNTFIVGDYVEITSGWAKLNSRIARVKATTTTSATLEAIDTTSTINYPIGGGTGSLRKVTGFTQVTQILGTSSSGGEQQFWEGQLLEGDSQIRIPTVKSAAGLEFTIGDDPTLPGYILAKAANDDRLPRALMVSLSNGSKLLYNGYVGVSVIPSLDVNVPMQTKMTYSMTGQPVRYAA